MEEFAIQSRELSDHAMNTPQLFKSRSLSITETGVPSTMISQTNTQTKRLTNLSLGKTFLQKDDASVKVKPAFTHGKKTNYSHLGRELEIECWSGLGALAGTGACL